MYSPDREEPEDTLLEDEEELTTEELEFVEKTQEIGESKADKFVRLAESRVNKAIVFMERLGTLANASTYEYTEEQVGVMFQVLEHTLEETKKKFQPSKKEVPFTFSTFATDLKKEE